MAAKNTIEIFENYQDMSKELRNKTEYVMELRDAIVTEYRLQGYCRLVDKLIENAKKIDKDTYSGLFYAHRTIIDMKIIEPEKKHEELIEFEYKQKKQTCIKDRMYKLREIGQDMHLKNLEEESIKKEFCAFQKSQDLVKKYLEDDREEFKKDLEDGIKIEFDKNRDMLGKIEITHNEMCNKTNELQATWAKTLTSATEEMYKIKDELYVNLRKWQKALYPYEINTFADRYIELYRIINIDKFLNEEILLNEINKTKANVNGNIDRNVNADENVEEIPLTIERLKKLNKTLNIFIKKFETSLNTLGLYVYYPKEGDKFDEIWHTLEDESIEGKDKFIDRCIIPGIAKKIDDEYGDDVIIPAIVVVED